MRYHGPATTESQRIERRSGAGVGGVAEATFGVSACAKVKGKNGERIEQRMYVQKKITLTTDFFFRFESEIGLREQRKVCVFGWCYSCVIADFIDGETKTQRSHSRTTFFVFLFFLTFFLYFTIILIFFFHFPILSVCVSDFWKGKTAKAPNSLSHLFSTNTTTKKKFFLKQTKPKTNSL